MAKSMTREDLVKAGLFKHLDVSSGVPNACRWAYSPECVEGEFPEPSFRHTHFSATEETERAPESVCRALLADSTTANKIQGPELECSGPSSRLADRLAHAQHQHS